jgi:hypothetical protein
LAAANENAHPDLLKKVFGGFAVTGEEEQIAQQPVLVADDELIEQAGFLVLEPMGDGKTFLPRLFVGRGGGCFGEECAYGSNRHIYD